MEALDVKTKRLSREAKDKDEKQWYKDTIDFLDHRTRLNYGDFDFTKKRDDKINYNLYNGIIDKSDFEYIYQPYGHEVGELPADFSHKDIVSGKIKVLLGMEMERPFSWNVVAVNPEATTRKEQMRFGMMRDYVVQQIMAPIQEEIQMKYAEQLKGGKLSQQEQQNIQQQVAQEIEAKTPDEVLKYMKRDHQDPAEALASQLLMYTIQEQDVERKFNLGWKHGGLSAKEVYWIGELNDRPKFNVINPLYFEYDKNNDIPFVEEGEWAGVEYWMTPTEVATFFSDDLTDDEIDDIYEKYNFRGEEETWNFDYNNFSTGKVRVLHRNWKALRKIGFLTYIDKEGEVQLTIVDETFKMDEKLGHVKIDWEWIPEAYEGYKIDYDKYVKLRPVPGQYKTLDNLYECKLSYVGGIYDSDNSIPTSLMDRMKVYQWYYNVIMYRIELLMASDKGKLLLMNINMIPTESDIDMNKWLYYAEALKIGWMNPNEEGNMGADVTNAAKEIDMSLASDIQKYIELANYVEQRCGASIGITKEMEGRINQYQAVRNTEQALSQGNYIVEPYFDFHNIIKRNALTALLNLSKVVYSNNEVETLNYVLDDFSKEIIKLDKELLSFSHYGLYVTNSLDTVRIKESIENLALTAMQNQTIEMSDVVKVLKTDNITSAEESLLVAEDKKRKEKSQLIEQESQARMKEQEQEQEFKKEEWEHEKEVVILKEKEKRETVLQQQAILAMGFDEEKDRNNNQIPDVLEVAKLGIEADLKGREQTRKEKELEHKIEDDKEKNKIARKSAEQKPAKKTG